MDNQEHNIIIVDDDDFLVDMYATKFSLSNIKAEACNSGPALLEKLRAGATPELILLDIVMSGMTGIEALKKMREEKLAPGVPVVMLTNQNDEKDVEEAKNLGIATYIVKSAATPAEVVAEVQGILNDAKK